MGERCHDNSCVANFLGTLVSLSVLGLDDELQVNQPFSLYTAAGGAAIRISKPLSGFSGTSLATAEAALRPSPLTANRTRKPLHQESLTLGGCEVWLGSEDISHPTRWEIEHDRHTLIVHLDGEMRRLETRIGNGNTCRNPARVGEMWLIPSDTPYVSSAVGEEITYAEFNIEPEWMAELAGVPAIRTSLRPITKFRDPILHGMTGRLMQLASEKDDMAGLLRESVIQFIGLHLMREYGAGACPPGNESSSLTGPLRRRLEDYILAHLDQRLSLDELAQLARLPSHRLIAAFRASFGQTPLQYIISQRLQLACRLLESTRQDISAIAMATGFSSHSHLSHVFKQRHGLTPQEFRRRVKGC